MSDATFRQGLMECTECSRETLGLGFCKDLARFLRGCKVEGQSTTHNLLRIRLWKLVKELFEEGNAVALRDDLVNRKAGTEYLNDSHKPIVPGTTRLLEVLRISRCRGKLLEVTNSNDTSEYNRVFALRQEPPPERHRLYTLNDSQQLCPSCEIAVKGSSPDFCKYRVVC
jgi:hypothetical protein